MIHYEKTNKDQVKRKSVFAFRLVNLNLNSFVINTLIDILSPKATKTYKLVCIAKTATSISFIERRQRQ